MFYWQFMRNKMLKTVGKNVTITSTTLPFSILRAKAGNLVNYTIKGNSEQDGTPTPSVPVDIESCGDVSENLFDKDNANILASGYIPNTSGSSTITSSFTARTVYIPCEASTTYSLYFGTSYTKRIASSSVIPALGTTVTNIMISFTTNTVSYTTDSTASYLVVQLFVDGDVSTSGATIDSAKETLVIVEGSTAPSSSLTVQCVGVQSGTNYAMFNRSAFNNASVGTKVSVTVSGTTYQQEVKAIDSRYVYIENRTV